MAGALASTPATTARSTRSHVSSSIHSGRSGASRPWAPMSQRYPGRITGTTPLRWCYLFPLARHDAVGVVDAVDRLDRAHHRIEVARVGQLEVELHLGDAVRSRVGRARHDV